MDFDGKPGGTGFITPVITYGGVIYVAGQGAHSHDQSEFPMDIDTHTKKVMEKKRPPADKPKAETNGKVEEPAPTPPPTPTRRGKQAAAAE